MAGNKFSFDRSQYHRPQDRWECGRARDGESCLEGPDVSGNCRDSSVCVPKHNPRTGEWSCTRDRTLGAPCTEGPLPCGGCSQRLPQSADGSPGTCAPRRSLRARRGRAGLLAALFSFSFLVLSLSGPPTVGGLADPGPLSSPHAGLACADCHRGAEDGSALFGQIGTARADSQLCLDCHDLGDAPHMAHGVSEGTLDPLTEYLASSFGASNSGPHASLECASCHQEHGGTSITPALSDRQCESCHATSFAPFADAHGEFALYPYQPVQDRAIRFDHATHYAGHFAMAGLIGADAITSCDDCHALDPTTGMMRTRDVESSCMSCHESAILSDPGLMLANTGATPGGALEVLARAAAKTESDDGDSTLAAIARTLNDRDWNTALRRWAPTRTAADRVAARADFEAIGALISGKASPGWSLESGSGWWRYRPSAHQDRFLTGLVETLARVAATGTPKLRSAATQALADPAGLGRCTTCHGVTDVGSEGDSPWSSRRQSGKPITVGFRHDSHLTSGLSCDACHRLEADPWLEAAPQAPRGLEGHPKRHAHLVDFEWIRSARCAECHDGNRASDRCSECHVYHQKRPLPR